MPFGQVLLLYRQSTSSTDSLRSHSIELLSCFMAVLLPFLMLVLIRAETCGVTYIKWLHVSVVEFPHSLLYNTTGPKYSCISTCDFIILRTQTAKIKSYLIQRVWWEGHNAGITNRNTKHQWYSLVGLNIPSADGQYVRGGRIHLKCDNVMAHVDARAGKWRGSWRM